jgi:prevent-host-death family protein
MKATEIGAFEAKTKFAELLQKVTRGQEFLITKRGKPVARLVSEERKPSIATKRSRAWALYQKIQKSGPKLTPKQLDHCVRESRAELLRQTEKVLR